MADPVDARATWHGNCSVIASDASTAYYLKRQTGFVTQCTLVSIASHVVSTRTIDLDGCQHEHARNVELKKGNSLLDENA